MKKIPYFLALAVTVTSFLLLNNSLFASDTDERIESEAKQSYVFKTYLKDDDVKFQSEDGVVTLTGTVSEGSHKTLAGETIANIAGVKSVDNQIEVKGDAPAELSDAWLITKVKTTLWFHRNVSGIETEVLAKDGVITLRGKADSKAQKDLTTEYAKDIEGVKDVNNEMTVLPATPSDEKTTDKKIDDLGEAIDDASTTALVKTTLLYHRSTSGLNTKVDTKEGVVTLSGKAKNAAEKDLATKLASDVRGVEKVVNNMTVDDAE